MRSLIRPVLFGLLILLGLQIPVIAKKVDSAKVLYDKGADAEARQNYELAYDCFKQAFNLKPKDLRYRTAYERTRFYAAAAEVHRGQLLRDAGKLDEALGAVSESAGDRSFIVHCAAGAEAHGADDQGSIGAATAVGFATNQFLAQTAGVGAGAGGTGSHFECADHAEGYGKIQRDLRNGGQAGGDQRVV